MHPPQSTHPHDPSPKIIMEEGNSNWDQLPLHWVGVPVQVPLLWHILVVDPVKMYPLLQENSQVCPGKLEQGSRLPCGGAYSCWQCLSMKKSNNNYSSFLNWQLVRSWTRLRRDWKYTEYREGSKDAQEPKKPKKRTPPTVVSVPRT